MLLTLLIGLAISHAPGRSTFLQNGTRTVLKCQVYYHGIPWLLVMFDLEWGKRTYHRIKMWPCERVQNSLNKNYWLGKVKVSSHWQYCTASAGNDWTRTRTGTKKITWCDVWFAVVQKKNIKNRQISILLELCHWHKGGHFGILLQSLAGWGVHISFRHYKRERERESYRFYTYSATLWVQRYGMMTKASSISQRVLVWLRSKGYRTRYIHFGAGLQED